MNEELKKKLSDLINSTKVFLFMKGTPDHPECGFSMKVVQILNDLNVKFGSFNVLSDSTIRQGIKDYADWPTIPQLYINGKFVGGCDITIQMSESGDLQKMLS